MQINLLQIKSVILLTAWTATREWEFNNVVRCRRTIVWSRQFPLCANSARYVVAHNSQCQITILKQFLPSIIVLILCFIIIIILFFLYLCNSWFIISQWLTKTLKYFFFFLKQHFLYKRNKTLYQCYSYERSRSCEWWRISLLRQADNILYPSLLDTNNRYWNWTFRNWEDKSTTKKKPKHKQTNDIITWATWSTTPESWRWGKSIAETPTTRSSCSVSYTACDTVTY